MNTLLVLVVFRKAEANSKAEANRKAEANKKA